MRGISDLEGRDPWRSAQDDGEDKATKSEQEATAEKKARRGPESPRRAGRGRKTFLVADWLVGSCCFRLAPLSCADYGLPLALRFSAVKPRLNTHLIGVRRTNLS
jgi:hypothetical protein